METIRIFIFSDAGYASLRGMKSVESVIVLGGQKRQRDGSIVCLRSPLDCYSRQISRVCRSAIAAEAVASANGIELGLWHHAIITELISGKIIDLRPRGEDPFPLCTPFLAPPSETLSCNMDDWPRSTNCVFKGQYREFLANGNAILACNVHGNKMDDVKLYREGVSGQVVPECRHPQKERIEAYTFLKVIALSDCANIFTAVANWQPRSVGKLTSLPLCFIRDVARSINFSFSDAAYNMADTSAKPGCNRHFPSCFATPGDLY